MRPRPFSFPAALLVASCASAPASPPRLTADCGTAFDDRASFTVDRAQLRARGASDKLLAKVDASVHRYFRLLAVEFAGRTCASFKDMRWHLPVVGIHGDAHLEQFVVTRDTYGLEDFDQAGFGPAVVDLVRYATSLRLACREVSWDCRGEDAVLAYFAAYRDALDHPPESREAPPIVERLRQRAPAAPRLEWLSGVDQMFRALEPQEEAQIRARWSGFVALMKEIKPGHADAYYDPVRIGALELGLGSALEKKYLFRIRGETDAPEDDLILEARSTTPPAARACTWRPAHGGSLQAFLFMAVLGRRMPEAFGFAELDAQRDAPEYWVQSWDPGYRELSIADLESQADLESLARDAAAQLAGHFWSRFPEPLRAQQRRAQLLAFDRTRARAIELSRELAEETVREWERFKASR